MTKKDQIKCLKLKLKIAESEAKLNKEALDPYRNQATLRGMRMQAMLQHMRENDLPITLAMKGWFYIDGTPII